MSFWKNKRFDFSKKITNAIQSVRNAGKDNAAADILFSCDGVILQDGSSAHTDYTNKLGNISIIKYGDKKNVYLEWKIKTDLTERDSVSFDDSQTGNDKYSNFIKIDIKDIREMKVSKLDEQSIELSNLDNKWIFGFQHGDIDKFNITLTELLSNTDNMNELYPTKTMGSFVDNVRRRMPNLSSAITELSVASVNELTSLKNKLRIGVNIPKLPKRKICERGKPVSLEEWLSFKDDDGRITDTDNVLMAIFRGGVSPDVRKEVWKYLLGYYNWEDTLAQNRIIKAVKEDEYYVQMMAKMESLESDTNNRDYWDAKEEILKDVDRTDKDLPYFSGDDNPHVAMFLRILVIYSVVYNPNLGYVQGMDMLLSPILYLLDNESEAFWCFVGFMRKTSANFEEPMTHVLVQFGQLMTLLSFLQPDLAQYLKKVDADHMQFCIRWIVVWFKRHLSMEQVPTLWEVLWTDLPCKNFHLLICIALLELAKDTIITNNYDSSEILTLVHEQYIDVPSILNDAEAIYHQIAEAEYLPENIASIFGLPAKKP